MNTLFQSIKKLSDKPENIPANPTITYKDQWNGFSDWLGKQPFE
jgi:hypothetical protein